MSASGPSGPLADFVTIYDTNNFHLVVVIKCHNGTVNNEILGVSVHLPC